MTDTSSSIEGPGKGKAFFDRAKTVAATGNFDYAIDMYIEGLNREPDNLNEHKALREVAFRRKMAGGKVPSGLLGPKPPFKGKNPKEALLNAEWTLSKDFGNRAAMMTMMRNAAQLNYVDVAVWIGTMARENNRTDKSPKLDVYLELADIFEKIGEFNEASKSVQEAIQLKPNDMELHTRAKDLSAQETLKRGQYEKGEDFKKSIKDTEETKKLMEEENLSRSEEYRIKAVMTSKAEYDKNPLEVQNIAKHAKALTDMDEESYENQAIDILNKAYNETKVYRFKVQLGDIKIKQFKRNERLLKDAYAADPEDKEILRQLKQLTRDRLMFELEEFRERSENFPTDMGVRFEYGARLFHTNHFDEAIAALQEAQQSPKHRVKALHYLGLSFMAQKMLPEAIDTFKRSIDEYDLAATGNKEACELFYWYGRALQENGNSPEAIDVYSKIVRWDISFRDARKRLNELRAAVGGNAAPPAA
jgi:tetratricopeptide (TPR) repeat protein